MRRFIGFAGLAVAIALAPVVATAAPGLRGMMRTWRDDAKMVEAMLSGRAPLDEQAFDRALRGYADDAAGVEARITGTTAAARDFKRRFVAFRADAETARRDLPQHAALHADLDRLMAQCRSCHDTYKN